jgi:hypothetical protein
MTADLDPALARRADAWAALAPGEQRRIIQAHVYHFLTYAQAVGFRVAHPPRPEPTDATGFGSLNSIPDPTPEGYAL